jgi:uncharacterized protein YdhG (YjbR/CyaY superfamily)
MKTNQTLPKNIDEYIAGFPPQVQEILQKIRMTIQKAAPKAEETMSYKMPTFNLNGHYLVYFAAYKNHIGFYRSPIGAPEFQDALTRYQAGRGTLQFPLDQPIPYPLISRIVKFRAKENLAKPPKRTKA